MIPVNLLLAFFFKFCVPKFRRSEKGLRLMGGKRYVVVVVAYDNNSLCKRSVKLEFSS